MTDFATIEEACDLVTDGTHYTPKNAGAGIPFLTVKDVTDSGLDFVNCSFITEDDYALAKAGSSAPEQGDVLFSKDGTVGKVHVVKNGARFAVLSSLAILRPRRNRVDSGYLGHVLRLPQVLDEAIKRKTGSAIRRIILSDLKRVRIPLPSIVEQQRIAEILDRAEALCAKRRAAISQLDTLTLSIFLDLFGHPVVNPRRWPLRALGELGAGPGAIVDGPFGSAIDVKRDYVEEGEIPVIRTKNVRPFDFVTDDLKRITRSKFSTLERSAVIPGDIILTKVGTIGNVCLFPAEFTTAVLSTTGSCRIRPNENLTRTIYLAYFLHLYRGQMMKLVAEGVQGFLNMSHIKSFRVPIPPLCLQDDFACRFNAIEGLKTKQRGSLSTLDSLFVVLQQRAFRGEL